MRENRERREGDRGREGKEGKSWEGKGEGNRGRRKKHNFRHVQLLVTVYIQSWTVTDLSCMFSILMV